MTPLQKQVNDLIARFEEREQRRVSGRELSTMLGKSRNHLSQILNDGLVPSGEVLVQFAKLLGASDEERRELLIAAMQTKVETRSRDSFWLQHALDLTGELMSQLRSHREFVRSIVRESELDAWLAQEAKRAAAEKKEGGSSAEHEVSAD
ncbi:MAG: helix-turn-helix transcriptional regulator [Planctomycetes bacterium]|nr:helix-turn-helix transcriptional regulator [Planctomycetota bacterium]